VVVVVEAILIVVTVGFAVFKHLHTERGRASVGSDATAARSSPHRGRGTRISSVVTSGPGRSGR
jgi:hypothetical protein